VVAREFGGPNYGVEAIWRKPGRPRKVTSAEGVFNPQSTTGQQGRRSEEFLRHENFEALGFGSLLHSLDQRCSRNAV